jgi:hypothetical protein
VVISEVEIYKHLYIEEITTDSEAYHREIGNRIHLKSLEYFDCVNIMEVTDLKWDSPNSIHVKVNDVLYSIVWAAGLCEVKVLKQ